MRVHGNHPGVPVVTTNASGQVVTPANDFLRPGFPGQSQVLSDLDYNRARDYDPVTGRYIQADPIGLAGDVNPYVYALSNPVNGIDPLGAETTWERYTGLPDSYRRNTMNAIAGWSDGFTFGATWHVREWFGSNRDIDLCSPFYNYAGLASLGGALKRTGVRTIKNGDMVYREYLTSKGPVEMLANAKAHGDVLQLRDIAIFPRGAERLPLGSEVHQLKRQLANEAAQQGFRRLRITGTRISGAKPGKKVNIKIDLD